MPNHIKALLSHYDEAYVKHMGVRSLIGAKDAALAKRLLARYSLEQLTGWVDQFFVMADPFIEQSGYTFGVFSACLPKVIAADRRTTTRQQQRDEGDAWIQTIMARRAQEDRE